MPQAAVDDEQKSFDMNTYSEVLARCLEELENQTATIEECVARYPQFVELEAMLSAVAATRALPQPVMAADDLARIRQQAIAQLRANTGKMARPAPATNRFRMRPVWMRFGLAACAVLILIMGSGFGLVKASSAALPGDSLYVIKRIDEQIELAFAPDQSRFAVLGNIARARLDEIDALLVQNRPISVSVVADTSSSILAALLAQPDEAERNILIDSTRTVFSRAQATGAVSQETFNSILQIASAPQLAPPNAGQGGPTPAQQTQVQPSVGTPSAEPVKPTRTPEPGRTATATASVTLTPSPTRTPSPMPSQTPIPSETVIPTDTTTPQASDTATVSGDDATAPGKGKGPVVPTRRPTQKPQAGGNGNGNGNGNGGGNGNGNGK